MTFESPLDDEPEDEQNDDEPVDVNFDTGEIEPADDAEPPEGFVRLGDSDGDDEAATQGWIEDDADRVEQASTFIATPDDEPDDDFVRFHQPNATLKIDGEVQEVAEIESLEFTMEEGEPVEGTLETHDGDVTYSGSFAVNSEDAQELYEYLSDGSDGEHTSGWMDPDELEEELENAEVDAEAIVEELEGDDEEECEACDNDALDALRLHNHSPGAKIATFDPDEADEVFGITRGANVCGNCGSVIGDLEYEQIVNYNEDGPNEFEIKETNYCPGCGEPVEEVLGDEEPDTDPTIEELIEDSDLLSVAQHKGHHGVVHADTRKITLEVIDDYEGRDLIEAIERKAHEQGAYAPGQHPARINRD